MQDGVLVVMDANNSLRVLGGSLFPSGFPISTDFSDSYSEFFSKLRISRAVLSISGSKVVSFGFKDLRPSINKMPKTKIN
jgi:hypothetical protein